MLIRRLPQIVPLRALVRKSSQNLWQHIDVHPEVQRSLRASAPVVALESTIITHGMPHPHNLTTAHAVEDLVLSNGATPATIAIIDGRIKVGMTQEELLKLASKCQEDVVKCSRRDLPFVVSQSLTGGTTVAATMMIAHMVGLRIFATGGVGGVHRDGHITMDVSADLLELGRTPVAVVCSGVKSILDIARTLEYLETQGVCVATFDVENRCFPDFYTRDSGYRAPYNLRDPMEAAKLIRALHDLKMKSGILIGVPIPESFEADKQQIRSSIEQAYAEASAQNVTGKLVTPFLLAAIAAKTKGNSLAANIALIKNNATVAARIACELYREQSHAVNVDKKLEPLVIGASIMDFSLTLLDELPATLETATLQGATFKTQAKQSAGGVGRNLAEGIFKLNGGVHFISAVGDDHMGKTLLHLLPQPLQADVEVDGKNATSLCSVIFDKRGECKLILGNMQIHGSITPDRVRHKKHLLRGAPLIIMDGNLPVETMEYILQAASKYQRPVFYEPTDMTIAGKPFTLPRSLTEQIKIISPNIHELKTIVEAITKKTVDWQPNLNAETPLVLAKATEMLISVQSLFDCILLTLGHHGMLISLRGQLDKSLFDAGSGEYTLKKEGHSAYVTRFYAAPTVKNVKNVSGAGDSFSSAFITGLLRGYEIERCVAMGFIAAERALQSTSAVPTKYFESENEEQALMKNTLKNLKIQDI